MNSKVCYTQLYLYILIIVLLIFLIVLYNSKNYNETFQSDKNQPVITLYYATWCGHSRTMLPEWSKFIQYANQHLKHIKIVTQNCDDDNQACKLSYVNGFPTIVLHKGDQNIIFNDQRTLNKFIEFVNKNK